MPTYAKFNDHGGLVYMVETNERDGITDPDAIIIPDGSDVNNIFRHPNGAIGPRIEVVLTADKTVMTYGGDVTFKGLPRGCTVEVNGVVHTATDGSLTVSSPDSIHACACGMFYSDKVTVLAYSAEELLDQVRAERNRLLGESDWTQMPDANLTEDKISEWAIYRTALRDITESQPDATINTVVWPTRP